MRSQQILIGGFALMAVLLFSGLLFAESVEKPPDVALLLKSIQAKNWPIVLSAAFTLVVWVFRNVVRDRAPKEYLPYITMGIAVLTTASIRISQHMQDDLIWWHGLIQGAIEGITVGLCSMGVWSVGAKKVLPIKGGQ